MRPSIASSLLAGGMLALGACAPTAERAEMADLPECPYPQSRQVPTGRSTGDAKQDYECQSYHVRPPREVRGRSASTESNAAVDRSLRRGG